MTAYVAKLLVIAPRFILFYWRYAVFMFRAVFRSRVLVFRSARAASRSSVLVFRLASTYYNSSISPSRIYINSSYTYSDYYNYNYNYSN